MKARTDPAHPGDAVQAGVIPNHVFKNLKPEEDPIPRILEILDEKAKAAQLNIPRQNRRDPVLVSGLLRRVPADQEPA